MAKMIDVNGTEHEWTPQCKYSDCKPATPAPIAAQTEKCPFDSHNSPWFKAHPEFCRRCSGQGDVLIGGSSLDQGQTAQRFCCEHCSGTGKDPCFAFPAEQVDAARWLKSHYVSGNGLYWTTRNGQEHSLPEVLEAYAASLKQETQSPSAMMEFKECVAEIYALAANVNPESAEAHLEEIADVCKEWSKIIRSSSLQPPRSELGYDCMLSVLNRIGKIVGIPNAYSQFSGDELVAAIKKLASSSPLETPAERDSQESFNECSDEAVELLAIIENGDAEEGCAAVCELRKLLPNVDKYVLAEVDDQIEIGAKISNLLTPTVIVRGCPYMCKRCGEPCSYQEGHKLVEGMEHLCGKHATPAPADTGAAEKLEKIASDTVAEIAKGFYDPNDRPEYGRREPWLSIGQGTLRNYIVKALQNLASTGDTPQPLDALREIAIKILSNCAYGYCHPTSCTWGTPQQVIDKQITIAVEFMAATLPTREGKEK